MLSSDERLFGYRSKGTNLEMVYEFLRGYKEKASRVEFPGWSQESALGFCLF